MIAYNKSLNIDIILHWFVVYFCFKQYLVSTYSISYVRCFIRSSACTTLQSILYKDPNVAVLRGEGATVGRHTYPGPLVECDYWDHRLMMLTSLKDQISSAIVRNTLRNLEQTQSSYANSFYSLQKDITKVNSTYVYIIAQLIITHCRSTTGDRRC